MQQLKNSLIDVVLSHDWPRGIHAFGNEHNLFRRKPYFRQEASENKLGSQPLRDILDKLMPSYWFSAHMHVKFSALYQREADGNGGKSTKFLALDKCLPNRQYLQVLDLDNASCDTFCNELSYDREWLAILKSTDHLVNVSNRVSYMPGPGIKERFDFQPRIEELTEIDQLFDNNFIVPRNFQQTAEIHTDGVSCNKRMHPQFCSNPQTEEFCSKLKIKNLNSILIGNQREQVKIMPSLDTSTFWTESNPAEIKIVDDEQPTSSEAMVANDKPNGNKWSYVSVKEFDTKVTNPDEISIDEDDDEPCAVPGTSVKMNADKGSVTEFKVNFSHTNPHEISIDDDDDEQTMTTKEDVEEKTEVKISSQIKVIKIIKKLFANKFFPSQIIRKLSKSPNVLRTDSVDSSSKRQKLTNTIKNIERKLKQLDEPLEFQTETKIIPRVSLLKPLIDNRRRYKNPLDKYLNVRKSRSSNV